MKAASVPCGAGGLAGDGGGGLKCGGGGMLKPEVLADCRLDACSLTSPPPSSSSLSAAAALYYIGVTLMDQLSFADSSLLCPQ